MLRQYFTRVVKIGIVVGVAIGGTAFVVKYDYKSSIVVRLTRTVVTAIDIGRTYQAMLYSKDWDVNSSEYLQVKSETHKIGAEKLLELCKVNKGVYIKVGQHLGSLDYLLPDEYVTTLRVLHNDAPQNSVEELYKVIKEDLNEEPDNLFTDFEPEPLGSASLAQVHKAKLKDGTTVAVKVQHHYVRQNIEIDLRWMELVSKAMARIFPEFQMEWLIEEIKTNIGKELDFLQEGKNSEKAAEMFKNYTWLKVPKVFWNYSSHRVLVMEYFQGGQVNDVKYIDSHKIDRADLCRKLGDLYSHMIFISGFVHSDPHPGNILVRQDPGDKEVSVFLLDHGLYANLTDKFRYHYSKLWLSIISRNREEMRIHSEALGIRKELSGLFACIVSGRPWDSIMKGIGRTKPSSAEKTEFQTELPNFAHYVTQCLQTVDRQALLVLKTNDLIRNIERALGMQERMVGFLIMTKCCIESVYHQDYRDAQSTYRRQCLTLRYYWSIFFLHVYTIILDFVDTVKTNIVGKAKNTGPMLKLTRI